MTARLLHDVFRAASTRQPDRVALVDEQGPITYRELEDLVQAVAVALRASGVEPGARVVVWGPKSAMTVAALQAVLWMGAAYVPLDPSSPIERAKLVVEDCGASAVVVIDGTPEMVASWPDTAVLDLSRETLPAWRLEMPQAHLGPCGNPEDLAYILYTSGSTGTPKGVAISHRAALAFIDWAVEVTEASEHDRFSNHASFTFDLSVLDLYAAFSVGASVYLIPTRLALSATGMVETLHASDVTVWYSVPSAWTLMMREGGLLDRTPPPALRLILFAGEPFPLADLESLFEWSRLPVMNLYGPTETNVCTYHEVTKEDLTSGVVPIGRGCCGDDVWIETPEGRGGAGATGEIVVDGPTVMSGYWGKAAQQGPYRTGDIGRLRADGNIEYLGRRDQQVKVRGYRLELGDVQAACRSHPAVSDAHAIVVGTGATARLVCFVIRRRGHRLGTLTLRQHLADRLPRYALPDQLFFRESLPLSRNGKVDRSALEVICQDETAG